MKRLIQKEQQFKHPIAKVWKAISEGAEISKWFIKADFEPKVGYNYKFEHDNTIISGTVLAANPVHELIYTWVLSGTDVKTTVKWQLTENESGTLLQLEHSDIENYSGDTAIKMFNQYSGGWDACMLELIKYLDI